MNAIFACTMYTILHEEHFRHQVRQKITVFYHNFWFWNYFWNSCSVCFYALNNFNSFAAKSWAFFTLFSPFLEIFVQLDDHTMVNQITIFPFLSFRDYSETLLKWSLRYLATTRTIKLPLTIPAALSPCTACWLRPPIPDIVSWIANPSQKSIISD